VQSCPKVVMSGQRSDFIYTATDEPHISRRKAMIEKYGKKITDLYGFDSMSKYKTIFCVVLQMVTCYYIQDVGWPLLLFLAWVWGGTINHSLMLAVHELAHDLFFPSPVLNTWFSIFASLPLSVPLSQGFKKYHLIHHQNQGYDNIDPDLPTPFEGNLIRSVPMKILFVFFQPLIYVFRPLLTMSGTPTTMEIVAYFVQFAFNWGILHYFGGKALAYLFLSCLLGSGFHPLAAHFIAEHYSWKDSEETYSYYGPLNKLVYNVGYHNEHHDFPRIPGSRLPNLHTIAPEFYKDVPVHSSWPMVIINFILDPRITPFNRVVRKKNVNSVDR